MMNGFLAAERSSKKLFHYPAVLEHVVTFSFAIGTILNLITILIRSPTLTLGLVGTNSTAISLLSIVVPLLAFTIFLEKEPSPTFAGKGYLVFLQRAYPLRYDLPFLGSFLGPSPAGFLLGPGIFILEQLVPVLVV